jgi:hypothetical protein
MPRHSEKQKTEPGPSSNETELAEALNFDNYDLSSNREGHLTIRQYRGLLKHRRWDIGSSTFWILLFGGFPLVNLILSEELSISDFILVGLGLILAGLTVPIIVQDWKAYKADIHNKQVEAIVAPVAHNHPVKGRYYIIVQRELFGVPKAAYEAFTDSQEYAFYITPETRYLLSCEIVDAELH